MSAGSPRSSRSQTTMTPGCNAVSPQPVTDPTILDSVAGFINEVATYNVPSDTKDHIQWASFEQLDCDAMLENLNGDKIIPSPLILVLGYSSGIQVWAIPANGEAVELFSWRHGSVRVLRILPSPYIVGNISQSDLYAMKRPLMAICDATTPGPHHCSLSFLSLKAGDQVKIIKFKNPILDVLANRRSVAVTFSERIAIFDAFTLEDRLTVTTCYLSPGIFPNPVALGARWMAYAEKKLMSNKRSSGGNEGEGVQSYTATVLHAAKSLGKGLREFGETVANSLTGNPTFKPGSPGNSTPMGNNFVDAVQKGVVTILDIEKQDVNDKTSENESMIAHFAAHTQAIVCLKFDPSGLLLLTADKRGHDFHLFRIQPHPGGPALGAVHHLYILHRGDTTARVQDMSFSPDSRWVAVSTLRGTTHVFPITPYGGNVGVRTHATPHVVNRMSRFHRSAGLYVEGRSNSPVSLFDTPVNSNLPYNNPRLPPYPHPTIVHPLAQIRQPLFIQTTGNVQQRLHSGRPRLNSSSEDNIQVALRVCSCFATARAWFDNSTQTQDTCITKPQAKPVESLFVMSCYGTLLQYDLDPHHLNSVPKEKICDETPIELTVHAKAQWVLQRQLHLNDVPLPLSQQNLNLLPQDISLYKNSKPTHTDDRWLSQVEIITHAGPHRRLWMGPQFTFKTYTTTNGPSLSLNEAQTVDVGRSKPVNMPVSTTYPILIESGSVSSCEQSPKYLDTYHRLSEQVGGAGEIQLKEDLADAMLESPGIRESGGRCVIVAMKPHSTGVVKVVNPLGSVVTIQIDDDGDVEVVEDAVIHENCDEALFRPVVAPKAIFDINNITKSKPLLNTNISISETIKSEPVKNTKDDNAKQLKKDTVETLDTKDTDNKIIKLNTTVNQDNSKVQAKNNKTSSKYQSRNEVKIDMISAKTDTTKSQKITVKPSKIVKVVEPLQEPPIPIIDKPAKVVVESLPEIVESTPNITEPLKKSGKCQKTIERALKNDEQSQKNIEQPETTNIEIVKCNDRPKKRTEQSDSIKCIDNPNKNVEKSEKKSETIKSSDKLKKILEPSSRNIETLKSNDRPKNILEHSDMNIDALQCIDKPKKGVEEPEKIIDTLKSIDKPKKNIESSKNVEKSQKNIILTPKLPDPGIYMEPKIMDFFPTILEPLPLPIQSKKQKTKSKMLDKDTLKSKLPIEQCLQVDIKHTSKVKIESKLVPEKPVEEIKSFKSLVKTQDIMDSVDTFEFPFSSNKSKNEMNKKEEEEIFDFTLAKSDDLLKEDRFEDARDIFESFSILSMDESKKDMSEKFESLELEEVIVSSEEEKNSSKKPRKPKTKLGVRLSKDKGVSEKNHPVEVALIPKKSWGSVVAAKPPKQETIIPEIEKSIIILPEIENDVPIELPIKSYSTVAKQHLLEIDPHEDVCTVSILLPEKVSKTSKIQDANLLKVESKLSDDEKQIGSQAETTESSDDSCKIVAMDTEEDGCQPETIANTKQGGEQAADCIYRDVEDLSSTSSFSSASRASPSPSYSGENLLHFPGDSSSSL